MPPSSPLSDQVVAAASQAAGQKAGAPPRSRAHRTSAGLRYIEYALLAVAGIFLALRCLHLTADFPDFSEWSDWAKYTDEGWYGDAAIRLYQRGQWNVPGDFNPAAALPAWPALEIVLFRFTGVSLAAVRGLTAAVFALILLCAYLLLKRRPPAAPARPTPASVAPAVAVLLLAVSPFCFAFMRLAILEPMLILLTLIALLTASSSSFASALPTASRPPWRAFLLGLLLPLMILTKTTALFLFPAIFWMLWASTGFRWRAFMRDAGTACLVGTAAWGAWFGLFVRPHYLEDYRYLFSANAYTGVTLSTLLPVLSDTVCDGMWTGHVLYPLGVAAMFAAILSAAAALKRRPERLHSDPLPIALVLWISGYAAFLAYHDNLQPRYYLVLAVPLTLLVAHRFGQVIDRVSASPSRLRLGGAALAASAIAGIALPGAIQTLRFVRHPQYTFITAARELAGVIARERAAHPDRSALVLSISGSDLSLMTGLPSICDDFGTLTLPKRVAAYRPGWYATWNEVDDDKMEALAPYFHLERVAAYPVMDDPERNLLLLYRLDPADAPAPPPQKPARATRRALQTRVGQQPSPTQLTH